MEKQEDNYNYGIILNTSGNPIIEYNNIANCVYDAINSSTISVNNNYISDCNGKVGVDLTGEQSNDQVIYQNPQTSPIAEAGCGW